MKCLFWNLKRLTNSPTKLALKKLLVLHKPDLCFVAEPWIHIDNFSKLWLDRLGMKLFCVNDRGNLLSNLWCFCSKALTPVLINVDDQQITLQISLNTKCFTLFGVYASNCRLKRKDLWEKLQFIQNSTNTPWCCLGDFNSIMGAQEQRSRYREDSNNLIHIHTRGVDYTLTNGRRGRFNIQRRLDRTICNQDW